MEHVFIQTSPRQMHAPSVQADTPIEHNNAHLGAAIREYSRWLEYAFVQ